MKNKGKVPDNRGILMSVLSVPGKKNDELSYVFTEPIQKDGQCTISLFGIFHSQNSSPVYAAFIENTVKHFLDFYHRSPHDFENILHSEKMNAFEFMFEHSLQYTHEHLSNALQRLQEESQKTAPLDVSKIHFILGVIMDDTLFMCPYGKYIRAYLLHPARVKHASAQYSMFDILNTATGDKDEQSKKIFSSIISGCISVPQSKLVICNLSFLDYVSLEQLKHSLTNLKTEYLTNYYHTLLSKAHARNDFSAIFIDPWRVDTFTSHAQFAPTSHLSIESMLEKQKGTTTVLMPGMAKNIAYIAYALMRHVCKIMSSAFMIACRNIRAKKQINPKFFISQFLSAYIKIYTRSIYAAKTIIKSLFPTIMRFARILRKYCLHIIDAKFKPLPPNSKALLIVCILFSVLFIQSLFAVARQKSVRSSEVHSRELFAEIEQKLNLAEASIIYESDDRTKQMLRDAEQLLQKVDERSLKNKELKNSFGAMKERFDIITAKRTRVIDISSPSVIASLDESIPAPETIRFVGNSKPLILVNNDSVYAIDSNSGVVRQVNTQTKIASIPCAASFSEILAYICGGTQKIFAYHTKNDTLQTAPYDDSGRTLTDIAIFNKRLYTLDSARGVIAKHDRNGTGFGKGTLWIRDGSSVQYARQFAIDGKIYVLLEGTTIAVYKSGKKTSAVQLPTLPVPITEITQLWTNDKTDYLYVADSAGKRILMLDKKTNAYIASITSPLFLGNIQDLMTTKSDLLVIAGGKLLSIPLEKVKL